MQLVLLKKISVALTISVTSMHLLSCTQSRYGGNPTPSYLVDIDSNGNEIKKNNRHSPSFSQPRDYSSGGSFSRAPSGRPACIYITENGKAHCNIKNSFSNTTCDSALPGHVDVYGRKSVSTKINGSTVTEAYDAQAILPPRQGKRICIGGGYEIPIR